MIEAAIEWIAFNQTQLRIMGVVSLLALVLTPVIVFFLVLAVPNDYFLFDRDRIREFRKAHHPVVLMIIAVLRNIIGLVFLVAGIVMLVLPGQGVITILIGLTLINFPGKRSLELKLVRRKKVLATINWMRAKAHRPPLRVPDRHS